VSATQQALSVTYLMQTLQIWIRKVAACLSAVLPVIKRLIVAFFSVSRWIPEY
jgi:hypothetical protein